MEGIHSYPSPPNGWRQELITISFIHFEKGLLNQDVHCIKKRARTQMTTQGIATFTWRILPIG